MAARSIATLSLSFGLVSIPVKVYSATESGAAVHFNMLHNCGSRLKQQYVCIKENVVVERDDIVKGYEFDKDRYVTFTPAELKALEESARHTIDIVSFIPLAAVDPIYYDKAYYLAPDKRGAKPYQLLMQAMLESGRCALARWAWKGKQYVVQVRPSQAEDSGLILQQLLYADEVRSMKDLDKARGYFTRGDKAEVQNGELGVNLSVYCQNLQNQALLTRAASRNVYARNCIEVGGVWIDDAFNGKMETVAVKAMSKAYFRLLEKQPKLREVFQLGNHVVWVTPSGKALVIDQGAGQETLSDADIDRLFTVAKAEKKSEKK